MISGEVTQVLTVGRQLRAMEGLTLVRVRTQTGSITAADSMGVAPGEQVVMSQGAAAQAAFGTNCPADTVVLCVLHQ
jgi:microcompartment protein CcmK/EutM